MPNYSVLLQGENFPIKSGDEVELLGFYTTRKIKASNEQEAELKAVEAIKTDSELLNAIVKQESLEPRIYIEDIKQLKWWSRLGKNTGYTFYPMNSDNDF